MSATKFHTHTKQQTELSLNTAFFIIRYSLDSTV